MANLMPGESYGIPDDLYAKRTERKRKLAEALKRDSLMPQGQMVSGHFVAPSITQYLASGLKGYQANQLDRQSDKEEEAGAMQKQQRLATAQQKYLDALRPQQAQIGETKQPFEASQMDRFGAPQQGQVQATQPVMGQRQPTPQEMYAAQMQYAMDLQDPQAMLTASNNQIGYRVKQDDKQDEREYSDKIYNRGRADKLSDVDAERKYQDIVRQDTQGFQVSQQDRQFAQQFQMQKQSQNFAAGQQSRSQNFQAAENQKSRDATLQNTINKSTLNNKTPKLQEGERKAATLLSRLKNSKAQLNNAIATSPDAAKPELGAQAIRALTFGQGEALANYSTSDSRQQVESAQLDMLDAALTLGTGAAYTKEQLEGYRKSYFPQLGDSKKAVKDKQDRLNSIVKAAEIAAGNAASLVPDVPSGNSNVRTVDW